MPRVVVSMTSYPEAIRFAAPAVLSILEGNVLPYKVVLYLTLSQFTDDSVLNDVRELAHKNPRFEIRNYDHDIRSYRKLIPALIDFPIDNIVTVDDDVRYDKNMLYDILRVHKRYPNAIVANRAKRIILDAPYKKWRKYRWYHFLTGKIRPRFDTLQTGCAGVLYPPRSLKPEMLDPALFTKIAPTTDDIWFWAAAVANGTKIVPGSPKHNKPRGLGKPKDLSLKTFNVKSGTDENRDALEKILDMYPIIRQRIEIENKKY